MPVAKSVHDVAIGAVDSIFEQEDIPVCVMVATDTADKEFSPLRARLMALPTQNYRVLSMSTGWGNSDALMEAMPWVSSNYLIWMDPHVRIMDEKWLAKFDHIFKQDRLAAVIDTAPNTASATLRPIRRTQHKLPDPGCAFAAIQKDFASGADYLNRGVDPIWALSRSSMLLGLNGWHHAGIRYTVMAKEEPGEWSTPSETEERSESPSQTTQASSSATTTDTGGSKGFWDSE